MASPPRDFAGAGAGAGADTVDRLGLDWSVQSLELETEWIPADVELAVEGARILDRRSRPTPFLSRYTFFGGRRCNPGRRPDDPRAVFVDVHGARLFAVVIVIVALNILDAWFTVLFLSHGGQELNPVVDSVLRMGTWPFIALKSLGIGFCVGILTIAKNFTYARFGLAFVSAGYTALLGWHFWLYAHLD